MYTQRAIVKIQFKMPDGKLLVHPFLIINHRSAQGVEKDKYFTGVMLTHSDGHPQFSYRLTKEMIDGRWEESSSQVRLYLITSFSIKDILPDSFLGYVKKPFFIKIMDEIKNFVLQVE